MQLAPRRAHPAPRFTVRKGLAKPLRHRPPSFRYWRESVQMSCYHPGMFRFGSDSAKASPEFVPADDARAWVADGLRDVVAALGPVAEAPRRVVVPPARSTPRDPDSLFELICETQSVIDQDDLEFTMLEPNSDPKRSPLPPGAIPLGSPEGHMMHTFRRGKELMLLVMPPVFRSPELLFGNLARELGRMGLVQRGFDDGVGELEAEAAAELAGIALGMGVWVANGAYMFENACCGGGCGIDLRGIQAALSMPEACFALALDGQRKGISRRHIVRSLSPTQKSALKQNWKISNRSLPALAAPPSPAALAG